MHVRFAERIVVVSEWYNDSLENHIKSSQFSSTSSLARLARQILSALSFLNENGITHRALASENVLLTPEVLCVCMWVCFMLWSMRSYVDFSQVDKYDQMILLFAECYTLR